MNKGGLKMHLFTAKETTALFHEYKVKCDEEIVQEWMDDPYTEHIGGELSENDVWAFSD